MMNPLGRFLYKALLTTGVILLLFLPLSASAGSDLQEICSAFHEELKIIPHDSLVIRAGLVSGPFEGEKVPGCKVIFKSREALMGNSENLPSFEAEEGSKLHREGWRINEQDRADGAGSGSYVIEKDTTLCIVSWDQHAWIDETGKSGQSAFIDMKIRCMNAPSSK